MLKQMVEAAREAEYPEQDYIARARRERLMYALDFLIDTEAEAEWQRRLEFARRQDQHYAARTIWQDVGPANRPGNHMLHSALTQLHIEPGEVTPEDVREDELMRIEALMSTPPVPLSHIGRAHAKGASFKSAKVNAHHYYARRSMERGKRSYAG